MNRLGQWGLAGLVLLCQVTSAQLDPAQPEVVPPQETRAEPSPAPTRILVHFDANEIARIVAALPAEDQIEQRLITELGLAPGSALRETDLSRHLRGEGGDADYSRWMLLDLHEIPGDDAGMSALMEKLRSHPLVSHAERDYGATGSDDPGKAEVPPPSATVTDTVLPNDPLFKHQYYHQILRTPEAWGITTGSEAVLVAILEDRWSTKLREFGGRVVFPMDFTPEFPKSPWGGRHGTAIAGLIAAAGNNGTGIAGMDWKSHIMPISGVRGGVAAWAQAIEYATLKKADVLNISARLKLPGPSAILDDAISRAAAAGVIIVASSGNQNEATLSWPAASPYVIAVGATDGAGSRWQDPVRGEGSNYGEGLDVAAPGAGIVTLSPEGKRTTGEGTSSAAALVSGACALMRAVHPAITPLEVRDILRETAVKIGCSDDWVEGYNPYFGYGRLDVFAAVEAAQRRAR